MPESTWEDAQCHGFREKHVNCSELPSLTHWWADSAADRGGDTGTPTGLVGMQNDAAAWNTPAISYEIKCMLTVWASHATHRVFLPSRQAECFPLKTEYRRRHTWSTLLAPCPAHTSTWSEHTHNEDICALQDLYADVHGSFIHGTDTVSWYS